MDMKTGVWWEFTMYVNMIFKVVTELMFEKWNHPRAFINKRQIPTYFASVNNSGCKAL